MKKLLLMVASLLLCLGMTTVANHGSCGSCHTGCAKKADCGATCEKQVRTETRAATVKCPRQVTYTVYDEKPVTQTRQIVTETCKCPAPKTSATEWSKLSCSDKKCGHCESCMHRRRHQAEVVAVEANENENNEEVSNKKQSRAEKRAERKASKQAAH